MNGASGGETEKKKNLEGNLGNAKEKEKMGTARRKTGITYTDADYSRRSIYLFNC